MKKITKLVGLKKSDFDIIVNTHNHEIDNLINVRPARLIPVFKAGEELSLTSIFLASLKMVKEFRDSIFKELKFPRGGKTYFYTELSFPESEFSDSRIDGLIINVSSGVIKDAIVLEMKSKANKLDRSQVERYMKIAKTFKINRMVTISNEFVSDSKESPVEKLKIPRNFQLNHFSWTYILTQAHILLFDNEDNIDDEDQIDIMNEVVHYLEHPNSGLLGHTSMSSKWKEVCERLYNNEKLNKSDQMVVDAVKSWHQEEKDLALLLSRKLGSNIKSTIKTNKSLDSDIKKLLSNQKLNGTLDVKGAVSKLGIDLNFNKKSISFSVNVSPPGDKKNNGKVSSLLRQLSKCKKYENKLYDEISENIFIEPDFKFIKKNHTYDLTSIETEDFRHFNDIQNFKIIFSKNLGNSFTQPKKFVVSIETYSLKFYEAIVQHLTNWKKPPPKVDNYE